MIDPVGKEANIHGKEWNALHDGYFSDPAVAAPLIEKVRDAIPISKPEVIVDLGGGTGFLLRELIRNNIAAGIQLVNLDVSPKQLEVVSDKQHPDHPAIAHGFRAGGRRRSPEAGSCS